MAADEPTDDDVADRLLLPPCRPELIFGIPYVAFVWLLGVWMSGLTMFGAAITGTGVCLIFGFGLRSLIAWDFNVVSVIITYARTKLVAVRSVHWITSVTLDPLFGQR